MATKKIQSGRISYAPVAFDTPWYEPLLEPMVVFSNVAVGAWFYPCWRTARVRWEPAVERLLSFAEKSDRPIIYYSWHAHEPLILLAFRDFPAHLRPIGIGHDGPLSRMLQRSATWFGLRVWVYRRNSPVRPAQQIIDLLKTERCHIGLIPDSGGPYGKVKPGLAEIAQATDVLLVPVIIRARGLLRLKYPWRGGLPLPYCCLIAYHGQPFEGRSTSTAECQSALDELGQRVSEARIPFHSCKTDENTFG